MSITELGVRRSRTVEARSPVVGIVGAGTMGRGIAQLAAAHGHEVLIHDTDSATLELAVDRIRRGLARRDSRGDLPDRRSVDAARLVGRLHPTPLLSEVAARSDVIVEAVIEDLALKRAVFLALDSTAAPGVVLATNTSALSIDAIAAATRSPGRVVGLHFFNPAPIMPLVEVIAGRASLPFALASVDRLARGWGKSAVHSRDVPGFIVNRVNRPFTLEALRVLDAGEATIEEIDLAIRAEGFPMGPFQLMDLVGIDVNLAVARALFEGLGRPSRLAPSSIQERLVAEGRLGRKTGEGFYLYAEDGRRRGPAAAFASPAVGRLAGREIVTRISLGIINEAYHALDDRVAEPSAIDRALRLGASHPVGPFERVALLGGVGVVREMLTMQADRDGDRFRPAPALVQAADA